jgi:uncharacterized protein (TIGR02271 family)
VNTDRDYARDDVYEGRALVAAFSDRESAHEAASSLHHEGFRNIWTGVTRAADGERDADADITSRMTIEDSDDSIGAKIGRFFSGESSGSGLYDALVRHGVTAREAQRIDGSLAPNSTILTVDGSNHPELAARIIEMGGGHILAGEAFDDAAGDMRTNETGAMYSPDNDTILTGSRVLGYQNPDEYARGQRVDEQQRIQLREERLRIDKERVPAGTAEVTTDVVEHQQSVDVPVLREELFVERRPVAAESWSDADVEPIGAGRTISSPLTREKITVTKRPVVTEEVLVGKREVMDTEHVSETTREERLVRDDAVLTGSERTNTGTDVMP